MLFRSPLAAGFHVLAMSVRLTKKSFVSVPSRLVKTPCFVPPWLVVRTQKALLRASMSPWWLYRTIVFIKCSRVVAGSLVLPVWTADA